MSSFGGIHYVEDVGADYPISSSNKCVQGVPGFAFVIARRILFRKTRGTPAHRASTCTTNGERWNRGGKWRYTSPTMSSAFAERGGWTTSA
jgi:2-aminoethylphosphonate-pyruvate transaminase